MNIAVVVCCCSYFVFVLQFVSVDEATHISKLRSNDKDTIHHLSKSKLLKDLQEVVREYIQHTIIQELEGYAKTDNCIMLKSSATDMESFSLQVCVIDTIHLKFSYKPREGVLHKQCSDNSLTTA